MGDFMPLYSGVFRNSLHEFKVKVGDDMSLMFCLDVYQCWIVHVFFHGGWFYHIDLCYAVVGEADERWIFNHFEESH